MRGIVLAVFAIMLTWVALATIGLVVLRWRLGRANRVSPAVRSPAPLHWLWAPARAARLHRRLRAAVAMIHLAPSPRSRRSPSLSVDELRRELEYQAVELDQHLVIAVHHPRSHRRGLLASLDQQVAEVERLAVRLSNMSRPAGPPSSGWSGPVTPPEVLERMSQQLDLLDAAQTELAEIERASGLVDLDQLMAITQDPVTVSPPPPSQPLPLETRRTGRVNPR
jgi:plasmid stabilization system protein ParE